MQSGQLPAMKGLLTELQTIPAAPSSPLASDDPKPSRRLVKAPPETKGWQNAPEHQQVLRCLRALSSNPQDIGCISTIRVAFARQASCRGRVPCLLQRGAAMSIASEFKEFALKGNVMDLAVGIIIGAAFGKIVDSAVNDLIMPLIGKVTGGLDFSNYYVGLNGQAPGLPLADAKKAGAVF